MFQELHATELDTEQGTKSKHYVPLLTTSSFNFKWRHEAKCVTSAKFITQATTECLRVNYSYNSAMIEQEQEETKKNPQW